MGKVKDTILTLIPCLALGLLVGGSCLPALAQEAPGAGLDSVTLDSGEVVTVDREKVDTEKVDTEKVGTDPASYSPTEAEQIEEDAAG